MSTPKLSSLSSVGGSLAGLPKVLDTNPTAGTLVGSPKIIGTQSSAGTLVGSPKVLAINPSSVAVGGNEYYIDAGIVSFNVLEPVVQGSVSFTVVEFAAVVDFVVIEKVVLLQGEVTFCVVPPPTMNDMAPVGFIALEPVISAFGTCGYIPLYVTSQYLVEFNVVNRTEDTVVASVDFNVLGSNYQLYPVDFSVVELVTHTYSVQYYVCHGFVEFTVTGVSLDSYGPVTYNVVEPPYLWPVTFSVVKNVLRTFGVNYYVSQSIIPDSMSVSYRVGSGSSANAVGRYTLTILQGGIITATKSINILKKSDASVTFLITKIRQLVGGASNQLQISKNGVLVYDQTTPFSTALEATV